MDNPSGNDKYIIGSRFVHVYKQYVKYFWLFLRDFKTPLKKVEMKGFQSCILSKTYEQKWWSHKELPVLFCLSFLFILFTVYWTIHYLALSRIILVYNVNFHYIALNYVKLYFRLFLRDFKNLWKKVEIFQSYILSKTVEQK